MVPPTGQKPLGFRGYHLFAFYGLKYYQFSIIYKVVYIAHGH